MASYHQRFLDHYRAPCNRGKIDGADISGSADNPLCGDSVRLDIRLGDDGRVGEVRFDGEGCVVCIAAASILSEELRGKSVRDLKAIDDDVLLGLLGVPLGSVRRKCALLPLRALSKGLEEW